MDAFVGHIKSGLGVVAVLVCAIMGAISGSGFTGVAATGPIMIPKMEEQGYPRGYATALVTVSSVLGLLIPPSVVMIMFGWVTECSILACFLSTLGPGLIITALFCIIHVFWSRQFDLKVTEKKPFGEFASNAGKMTFKAVPALLCPHHTGRESMGVSLLPPRRQPWQPSIPFPLDCGCIRPVHLRASWQ
ncbi:MAG: TRAP transporter large permease subunit [Enterocloster bolteae]